MVYTVTMRTKLGGGDLEHLLPRLTAAGPFVVRDLAHRGDGSWVFTVRPCRPEMVVGFAKLAEFPSILVRELPIDSVDRVASEDIATAA
jgi:hypothetical protein